MVQLDDRTFHLFQLRLQALQVLVVLLGFTISIRQFLIQTRTHLLALYQQVFKMIDDIRKDRHYLASSEVDRLKTFVDENWVDSFECAKNDLWREHRTSAELVFRNFDQLGLLIREGRVPLDAIARFNLRPILQAWYLLGPYVKAVRKSRSQPSHGWEFENLVYRIILPGIEGNRGLWNGAEAHDFQSGSASEWFQTIRKEGLDPGGDLKYSPPVRLWTVNRR